MRPVTTSGQRPLAGHGHRPSFADGCFLTQELAANLAWHATCTILVCERYMQVTILTLEAIAWAFSPQA
jgi:hypothetical protein